MAPRLFIKEISVLNRFVFTQRMTISCCWNKRTNFWFLHSFHADSVYRLVSFYCLHITHAKDSFSTAVSNTKSVSLVLLLVSCSMREQTSFDWCFDERRITRENETWHHIIASQIKLKRLFTFWWIFDLLNKKLKRSTFWLFEFVQYRAWVKENCWD